MNGIEGRFRGDFRSKSRLRAVLEQRRAPSASPSLPSEALLLLNHSTFKPFERYSDKLLVRLGQMAYYATLKADFIITHQARRTCKDVGLWKRLMQFDLSDIVFLVVVLSIAVLLINSNGGGGGPRAQLPVRA